MTCLEGGISQSENWLRKDTGEGRGSRPTERLPTMAIFLCFGAAGMVTIKVQVPQGSNSRTE